jgi:hypothetical protein
LQWGEPVLIAVVNGDASALAAALSVEGVDPNEQVSDALFDDDTAAEGTTRGWRCIRGQATNQNHATTVGTVAGLS